MNNATAEQVSAAFTEWERRFREDPDSFLSAQEKASESAESYGQACAPYFLEILASIQSAAP